jgi:DNA polymerase I
MKHVVDIEADSLQPSTIHCIVAKNVETGKVYTFRERECINNWPSFSKQNITSYVMHNGISFDAPALNRLTGTRISVDQIEDTMIMSQITNPMRDNGHSLDAWGQTLGFPKTEFNDWSHCSDEMVKYCINDVELTARVYATLKNELRNFSDESVRMEHTIRFLIDRQQKNGFTLDMPKAMALMSRLSDMAGEIELQVQEAFYPLPTFIKEVSPKIKKDGSMSKVGLSHLGDDWPCASGEHSVVDFPQFNLASRQQIVRHLQHRGWKPTKFTEKGHAIVDEGVLKHVDIPEAQLIARYLLLQKRVSQIKQWIDYYDDDGRVHGRVLTLKAVSGRMAHHAPNMAQVPASYSEFGKECRECWIASAPDRVLVGCDASSLELRGLAHYLNDKAFINEVVNGDIHTANQNAAGLETRDQAKTFIYAFIYGAGAAKIGSVVGGTAKDGQRLIDQFLSNVPALKTLRQRVEQAAQRGYVPGLDGRRLKVRSAHSALNLLIQGAGAVICKQWLIQIVKMAKQEKLDANLVASIHDEYQFDVKREHAERFGEITKKAMKETEKILKVCCPLDSEYKIGRNWSETH